jgi:hypothetical protein
MQHHCFCTFGAICCEKQFYICLTFSGPKRAFYLRSFQIRALITPPLFFFSMVVHVIYESAFFCRFMHVSLCVDDGYLGCTTRVSIAAAGSFLYQNQGRQIAETKAFMIK